jgi:hypothetical protein
VYVAHSGKKQSTNSAETEIEKLVSIDHPGNRIKIVVNVFQLSEGWDVTNVWVIAPLRSLATFTNAIQTVGRGLRLPNGRRIGEDEADTLDILCFGKEDFGTIVSQAAKEFGAGVDGAAAVSIVGTGSHSVRPTRSLTLEVIKNVSFEVPAVSRMPGELELGFSPEVTRGISSYVEVYDVGSGSFGTEDDTAVRRTFEVVVRSATTHVVERLRFLDPIKHTAAVQKMVESVLLDLGGKPGMQISTDSMKLGLAVAEAIQSRYRSVASTYVAGDVSITQTIVPREVSIPVEYDDVPKRNTIGAWK